MGTEDAADHKCYEGCASSTFKNKGVSTPGACPSSYGVVEKDQVVEQCEDGVTNLRYCPGSRVNVTLKVKGEALLAMKAAETYCLHTEDAADHKCYEGCASSTFKNKG